MTPAFLIGKTIAVVQTMDSGEADVNGWSVRPLVITFEDGTEIYAQSRSNGAGLAIHTAESYHAILPEPLEALAA